MSSRLRKKETRTHRGARTGIAVSPGRVNRRRVVLGRCVRSAGDDRAVRSGCPRGGGAPPGRRCAAGRADRGGASADRRDRRCAERDAHALPRAGAGARRAGSRRRAAGRPADRRQGSERRRRRAHHLRLADLRRLRARAVRPDGRAAGEPRCGRHRQVELAGVRGGRRTPSTRCSARPATRGTCCAPAAARRAARPSALAAGQVWLATGSDLGGSLRTPAGFCGVVGIRPSPGRVARSPGELPFDTLSVEGPMGRTVGDAALMLDAMAGRDSRDPLSLEAPAESFLAAAEAPVAAAADRLERRSRHHAGRAGRPRRLRRRDRAAGRGGRPDRRGAARPVAGAGGVPRAARGRLRRRAGAAARGPPRAAEAGRRLEHRGGAGDARRPAGRRRAGAGRRPRGDDGLPRVLRRADLPVRLRRPVPGRDALAAARSTASPRRPTSTGCGSRRRSRSPAARWWRCRAG